MARKITPIAEKSTFAEVITAMNDQYGPKTIAFANETKRDRARVPFGIFAVDWATGGGLPLWETTCAWGKSSGGKTSLAINCIKASQNICWKCFRALAYCECSTPPLEMLTAFADIEGTFDPEWVAAIGANPSKIGRILGDYGEMYVNGAAAALGASDVGLVVVDSLAALVPVAEFDAPSEDQFIGNQARMIGRCVRKLKQRLIRESKDGKPCTVIFTNQLRIQIGKLFGDKETMSGGEAMKHEFSLLLRCVDKSLEKSGVDAKFIEASQKKKAATRHAFTIRKEKVLTLESGGEYVRVKDNFPDFGLTKGSIDDAKTIFTYAKDFGIVKPDGKAWLYFDQKAKTTDGIRNLLRSNFTEYLRTDIEIVKRAKERLGGGDAPSTVSDL
jgi:recombination protein RecA